MTDWQIPAALRNFGSVSQGVYVRKGSETSQTGLATGGEQYHRARAKFVPKTGSRRLLRLAHGASAVRSTCACSTSGNSGVGEMPLSADASTAWASADRSVE
jgi:hypothetical protein